MRDDIRQLAGGQLDALADMIRQLQALELEGLSFLQDIEPAKIHLLEEHLMVMNNIRIAYTAAKTIFSGNRDEIIRRAGIEQTRFREIYDKDPIAAEYDSLLAIHTSLMEKNSELTIRAIDALNRLLEETGNSIEELGRIRALKEMISNS